MAQSKIGIIGDEEFALRLYVTEKEDSFILDKDSFANALANIFEGDIRHCDGKTNLRALKQMIGTWEIDGDAIKEIKDSYHQLGVCFSYFTFDQNQLHTEGAKQFDSCKKHTWKINGCNIQIPCISVHKCPVFTEGLIVQKSSSGYRARYICLQCIQQEGDHLYEKPGIGGKILSLAESDDQILQERLLSLVTLALTIFNNELTSKNLTSTEKEPEKLPSKLLVLTALKMRKVRLNLLMKEKFQIKNLKEASIVGENLGKNVLSSYSKIQENISQLENLSSYEDYFNALPKTICSFFQALITVLQQQKQKMINKKRNQYLLWSLASKLWDAFNHPDPKTHPLFKGVPELNEEGFENILSFYEIGKSCLQKIFDQDVYIIEPWSTNKCYMCNINSYTYTQLKDKKDKEKKTNNRVDSLPQASIIQEKAKKAILDQLFESEELSEATISNVLLQLNAVSSDWTNKRVKIFWKNN
ncbi:4877_t:CDS:2, partial [Cetraspora pellucida]